MPLILNICSISLQLYEVLSFKLTTSQLIMSKYLNLLITLVTLLISNLSHCQRLNSDDFYKMPKFKWNDFSFDQSWDKIKKGTEAEKYLAFDEKLQSFFNMGISDSTKYYKLHDTKYQRMFGLFFSDVILKIEKKPSYNNEGNVLSFFESLPDNSLALNFLKHLEDSLNKKYGLNTKKKNQYYKKSAEKTTDQKADGPAFDKSYLDESLSYSYIEETNWFFKNFIINLTYIPEQNFIKLRFRENLIYSHSGNRLFFESEYDEKFTTAFKEFDNKNGYKSLKFGMLKSVVKNIVKYKDPDILKQYAVTSAQYKNWFYIPFDYCYLIFNKKNQLYDVSLSKDEYSNADYEQFLKELIELFGNPTTYKDKSGDSEFTLWKGKNLNFFIMRSKGKSIYVDFNCVALDDTSPTDKLY